MPDWLARLFHPRGSRSAEARSAGDADRGESLPGEAGLSGPALHAHPTLTGLSASTRRRILVVDDDAPLRLLLRTTLAADEFEVEEARSAEEAAELARFRPPSV